METDLERYAWLVAYELREAQAAATPEERREHEGLARAYSLKMYALENETAPALLKDLGPTREANAEPGDAAGPLRG